MHLKYTVFRIDVLAREFSVRLEIMGDFGGGLELVLPAWIPGSYMIRDFARNITSLRASDRRGSLAVSKSDKQTWSISPVEGGLCVDYSVYAFDLSVRSAYLDDTRAYFNGTSLFLRPRQEDDPPWDLHLASPDHSCCSDWRVATTLPAVWVDDRGFGHYAGDHYSELIDCPVEIGRHQRGVFDVEGIPHNVAVSAGGHFDMDRVCRDLSRICAEHASTFGELPITEYLFQVLAVADGYGGLEHVDSTSLICNRLDLPSHHLSSPDTGYKRFLGLCSHEYFHLWNVKRIRPERLQRADLGIETHSELLWAFEGITSYYDDLALVRSGLIEPRDYLELLAKSVTRVIRGPGRRRQSIAESSFDAWTRFYKQDENAPNAIVSYYTKGSLVALGLDVVFRRISSDRMSLNDLMKHLWLRFGRGGRGVPERGIELEAQGLLGKSLDDFFQAYVYGTEELPFADWFAELGIGYRLRAATGVSDEGRYAAEAPSGPPPPNLGARVERSSSGLLVRHILNGSAAEQAGLAPRDEIIAIDRERVSETNYTEILFRAMPGEVDVHVFRRGQLMVRRVRVDPPPLDTCDLWLMDEVDLSTTVRDRRTAWMASSRIVAA